MNMKMATGSGSGIGWKYYPGIFNGGIQENQEFCGRNVGPQASI
jgi:hypothetical protein